MAKLIANYGTELMILILFVMICPSLSSYCEDWDPEDFPSFVLKLSQNATEEFCELYEMETEVPINKFYDMLRKWAEKYSVQAETNRFIAEEMNYDKTQSKVLMERLQASNGTTEVKGVLEKALKLQESMHLSPDYIQNVIDTMMENLPIDKQNEATLLWNSLCPDDIYNECEPRF
ncbi:unnamed protein product [Onchocerca ochengi]|uniref:DUF148 domain-containing protein n=1 Tax=Onchocerca ochengi TaxID=42157 RepID=A0A182EKD3_ONCOC|nr:unnamed protein product [Onchocerca ochengi]